MPTDPALRQGPGRWTFVRNPHGILWTNDTSVVGFQPGPGVNPAVIEMLIASTAGEPGVVFDTLAAKVGDSVVSGSLDTWRPGP